MEENITIDMRIAAGVVKRIADENTNNPEILVSCKYVLKSLRHQLRNRPDSMLGGMKLDAEERYGLYRAKVILNLNRDVNKYSNGADPEVEKHFALIQSIVEEKIKKVEERGEVKDEKNIRR